MKGAILLFAALFTGTCAAAEDNGYEIKRVFASSGISVTVVVEVPAPVAMKCAVYDANENPLRVETRKVSPPIDEIMIITGEVTNSVASAKCWPME